MRSNRFIKALRRLAHNDSGQGMTEYIIIVALIAIMSIGFVSFFGDNVRGLFAASATALSGKDVKSDDLVKDTLNSRKTRGLRDFDKYKDAKRDGAEP